MSESSILRGIVLLIHIHYLLCINTYPYTSFIISSSPHTPHTVDGLKCCGGTPGLTWAKCRPRTPRSRSARSRSTRPGPSAPCKPRVRVPSRPPSHRKTSRHRRSRTCPRSCRWRRWWCRRRPWPRRWWPWWPSWWWCSL